MFVSFPFSEFNNSTLPKTMSKTKGEMKWLIGRRTACRKLLAKGDMVLFYQAGDERKVVVGSGELLSGLQNDKRGHLFVLLGNVNTWSKPVPIRKLVNGLSFIKHKKRWGAYFQGGIRGIPEADYRMIVKRARKRCMKEDETPKSMR